MSPLDLINAVVETGQHYAAALWHASRAEEVREGPGGEVVQGQERLKVRLE